MWGRGGWIEMTKRGIEAALGVAAWESSLRTGDGMRANIRRALNDVGRGSVGSMVGTMSGMWVVWNELLPQEKR